jgi:hypothetical protein
MWVGMLGLIAVVAAGMMGAASSPLHAQQTIVSSGHGAEAKHMRLLGHHDLQARSAYQLVIHQHGARWIAYVGHHGGVAMNPLTGAQEGNGTSIVDVTDPARPVFIRNFGLVGQQPGAAGPVPTDLHGPISTGREGKRVYFGYGTSSGGILQIVDRDKLLSGPKDPTPENLLYPQIARLDLAPFNGAHTTFPVLGVEVPEFAKDEKGRRRDFVVIVNESTRNECTQEARQLVFVVDVTDEAKPFPVANYQVREAEGDFCARGGRFGAHASHEHVTPIYDKRVMFFSWFNAGVRAVDIRDPYHPRELASYIPATTEKTAPRCLKTAAGERCKIAIQTNNVEVDDRGLIYLVDRANTGMHILELSGEARGVANFPR